MARQGTWREMWQRALTSPYLMLLFVASILLSIASFYTTYEGIKPFVQFAVIGFFITTAIQSLLFVVSWRLGFMFAGKEDVARVDMGVFVVCFSLSVFFSFNSLFNMIFIPERQQESRLGRVRDGATEAVNEVGQRLQGVHAELVEKLRGSPEYADWRRQVLEIADEAQRTGPQLRENVARQRTQRQEQYEAKAEAARGLAARKGTMQDEIASLRRQLEDFDAEPPDTNVEDLRRQVQELEVQIAAKQAEMEAEEEGIAESGKAGRGPKWKAKEKERLILENRLTGIEEKARIRSQQAKDHGQRRRQLAETLRATQLLFENIDTEIARKRDEAEAARKELVSFGSGGVEDTVSALREYPSRFEQHSDIGNLGQAERLCTRLVDELKTLGVDLAGKSCDRGPIMGMVAPIVETDKALAELDRHCLGADSPSFHEMELPEALAAAGGCLDLSKLPYKQISDLREELDRLEREEGPHASEFTKTTNALFAGEKDAYLALVLAVAMDLLVLFTGLIGAKSATETFAIRVLEDDRRDHPEVAAIKMLLRSLTPLDQKIGGSRYVAKIDLEDISDIRARNLIGQQLGLNTRSGLVLASTENPTLFFLRHDAQEKLEEQLESHRLAAGEEPSGTRERRLPAPTNPRSAVKRGTRKTSRGRSFFDKGERRPDHPGSHRGMPGAPAADSYILRPGADAGTETEEPDVRSLYGMGATGIRGNRPIQSETMGPVNAAPLKEAPPPSSGSGEDVSSEDPGLAYAFLHQNVPGKSS